MKQIIKKLSIVTLCMGGVFISFDSNADLSDKVKQALQTNNTTLESSLKDVSKNMSAIFAHRSLAPAETLGGGVGGFEIGVNVANVDLDTAPLKRIVAAAGQTLDKKYDKASLPIPALSAGFGFPGLPLDLTATYLPTVSGTSLLTAEIKYDVFDGGVVKPAVSISANYASATLADAFDVTSYGLDLAVSKGFGVGIKVVPFGGIGYLSSQMKINDKAKPVATAIKTSYDSSSYKIFAGASLQLGLFNLVGQLDKIGDYSAVSAKLGLRF